MKEQLRQATQRVAEGGDVRADGWLVSPSALSDKDLARTYDDFGAEMRARGLQRNGGTGGGGGGGGGQGSGHGAAASAAAAEQDTSSLQGQLDDAAQLLGAQAAQLNQLLKENAKLDQATQKLATDKASVSNSEEGRANVFALKIAIAFSLPFVNE